MVQSTNQNVRTAHLLARLEAEIRDTVAEGLSLGEIQELVSIIVAERPKDEPQGDIPIYDELPDGLITIAQAAQKYGRSRRTFQGWIRRGNLKLEGRLRASARGGGKLAVSEAELVTLIDTPPKSGRPPST